MSNTTRGPFMQAMEKYTKSIKTFISAQGFGHYSKPNGGIPKSDLEQSVQTSLGLADTALQNFSESDPTVPAWAKQTSKPSYHSDEISDTNKTHRFATAEQLAQISTNKTNISSTQNMICDTEFSTSTAYAVGDIVRYENRLYKFNTAHSAGTWNSAEVDEVTAVDLISSGSETDSVTSKEIYVTKPINQPDTWESKTWTGLTDFRGDCIWTDGENIYYSFDTTQYVLDKATSTWSTKSWSGLTSLYGDQMWTDGDNIYYSDSSVQYILDKATSTWSAKSWSGLTNFNGRNIWTDGENIYSSSEYVLNKATSTWSTKSWSGLTSFVGLYIWTDGENIYYSLSPNPYALGNQYVLDKATSTWSTKSWSGLTSLIGQYVWTDGIDMYYSTGSDQYVLNKTTSTWSTKSWSGLTNFEGRQVWTDGENIYYSYNGSNYVLKRPLKTTKIPDVKNNAQLTALIGDINSVLEAVL